MLMQGILKIRNRILWEIYTNLTKSKSETELNFTNISASQISFCSDKDKEVDFSLFLKMS